MSVDPKKEGYSVAEDEEEPTHHEKSLRNHHLRKSLHRLRSDPSLRESKFNKIMHNYRK